MVVRIALSVVKDISISAQSSSWVVALQYYYSNSCLL